MKPASLLSGRGEDGFTLVELLVTLSLLSLLVLLLFGGLRFGVRAWDGAQAHSEGSDEVRVVQNFMRRMLEGAYPTYDVSNPSRPVVNFSGSENALTFLAPVPDALARAGRSWITLEAVRDGGDMNLMIDAVPELAGSPNSRWSSPLLHHVAAIRVAYFSGGRWMASWRGARTLPDLVRVRVEFGPRDRRVWPDLVVAPHLAGDASCAVQPDARPCLGGS